MRTQTGLCDLLLSLEAPNDIKSVAWHSQNIQASNKGSDRTARMRRMIWGFAGRTYLEISCRGSYMNSMAISTSNLPLYS